MMAFGTPEGWARSWTTYENDRFGYAVDVPSDFLQGEAPENNDGRTFSAPNGAGHVSVYGSFNALGQTPASHREWLREDLISREIRITYEATGKTWCVLSGMAPDGAIVYQRVRFSRTGETLLTVSFTYPDNQKETWDDIVARMGKSLHFLNAQEN